MAPHTRPPLTTVAQLAKLYIALLEELGVSDVTVVGNSIGGWIAAEMALLGSERISRSALVDAVGIDVADHPGADVSSLLLAQVFQLSFHNPERFLVDPSTLPPAVQAIPAGNRAALAVYGGPSNTDPSGLARVSRLDVATLVLWGESDQIVDPYYGQVYADAIPNSQFQLLPGTGHVPQLETPQQVLSAISGSATSHPTDERAPT